MGTLHHTDVCNFELFQFRKSWLLDHGTYVHAVQLIIRPRNHRYLDSKEMQ
jgi:hypothetical protein